MSDPKAGKRALALARELAEVIADTEADLASMPFFVRPMVRRGYKKRTGRSLDEWKAAAAGLIARLEAADASTRADALGSDRELATDLPRLAENYRTAPERAARGMRAAPATVEILRNAAARREQSVRDLLQALDALS